ncbi:hypothetical protein [Capillimicrobium parvum]|uniref:Uncharacterized protein n=1 Tax=Capillimicrobium parvum TaxID=2884022 RepID=A0A9E7C299_9ACTN|nr:hypothetical protein [Capillimicrobium parvum]UGS37228.1 hypothetical protein DSM104329_03643 [Capillimicrobium parvum]
MRLVGDPDVLVSAAISLAGQPRATGADYLASGGLRDLTDPDPPVPSPRQFADLLTTS